MVVGYTRILGSKIVAAVLYKGTVEVKAIVRSSNDSHEEKRVNLTSKVLPVWDRISCPVDRPQYFGRGGFRGFLAYITDRG